MKPDNCDQFDKLYDPTLILNVYHIISLTSLFNEAITRIRRKRKRILDDCISRQFYGIREKEKEKVLFMEAKEGYLKDVQYNHITTNGVFAKHWVQVCTL